MAYLIELKNLQEVLEQYAADLELYYKSKLAKGKKNATAKLADTAKAQVKIGNTTLEVSISLQDYWKYVEGGTKGSRYPEGQYASHFPPVDALLKWIQIKPVIPHPDANGKIPSEKSLAFLIGRKIATEGIAPFPALLTTAEQLNEKYSQLIEDALAEDVGKFLMYTFGQ